MFELCDKLIGLVPYEPGNGDYLVRLDANESFIRPPDSIKQEITNSVENIAFNRYPDSAAAQLCAAFADYYGVNMSNVTAGNGSDELLFIIASCFTQAGDTIVTAAPDFSMYKFYAHLAECKCIEYQKQDLEIDINELIGTVNRENARLLFFSNPCNPTGILLNKAQVKQIINSVNALVVLDEAYMDFSDETLIDEVCSYDNVILLRTMSKAVGMAAVRLGFAVANDKITKALKAAKSPYNINSISNAVGSVIYKNAEYLRECKARIIKSRDELYSAVLPICEKRGWRMKRTDANFLFLIIKDSKKVFEYLKSKGILVRDFGGALRITTGSKDENSTLIKALEEIEYEKS